jgi:uncharacterized metal-binding protein
MVHLSGRVGVLKLSLFQFQPFSNSRKMSHRGMVLPLTKMLYLNFKLVAFMVQQTRLINNLVCPTESPIARQYL